MIKTINIYLKDAKDELRLTQEEMNQSKEFHKVMCFLIDNLHDSDVIARVIRELSRWQQSTIKTIMEEKN